MTELLTTFYHRTMEYREESVPVGQQLSVPYEGDYPPHIQVLDVRRVEGNGNEWLNVWKYVVIY